MAAQRKIIHIDADSFYASVELRDNPELRGRPIAVGGSAERRGVIATASYEARKFGVRSAMASARAMSLCPELLIVPARFDLYREISAQFHTIFRDYSPHIEPLSLDEAYLDVSEATACNGSATRIAEAIRRRVREELRLTVSAGIAPNKFLAKVASDWNKPDGQFTIAPEQVEAFVRELPVSKINGVGRVTASKLKRMGVVTCGDLQQVPLPTLVKRFGKYGKRLSDVAHGVDEREVKTSRQRKSISVERTYAEDIPELEKMGLEIERLLQELSQRFERIEEHYVPTKRVVKVKFKDFTQTTREEVLPFDGEPWSTPAPFQQLLAAAWPRGGKPVRLLGVGLRLRPRGSEESDQLSLFGP